MRNRRRAAGIALSLGMAATAFGAAPVEGQQANAGAWGGFSPRTMSAVSQYGNPVPRPAWAAAVVASDNGGYDVVVNNHATNTGVWQDLGLGSETYSEVPQSGTAQVNRFSAFGPIAKPVHDTHGMRVADFDNDGDQDLIEVVGSPADSDDTENRYWRNDPDPATGENRYTLVSVGAAFELEEQRGRGGVPFDFNGDGVLDFMVGGVQDTDPPAGQRAVMLQGALGGTGVTYSTVAGSNGTDQLGGAFMNSATVTDYGPGTSPQALQLNSVWLAPGAVERAASFSFVDRPLVSVSKARDWLYGDFDGDLLPEVIVLRVDQHTSGTPLAAQYFDISSTGVYSAKSGLPAGVTDCAAGTAGDFDNDGDLDAFLGCTMPGDSGPDHKLLINNGNGTFSLSSSNAQPGPYQVLGMGGATENEAWAANWSESVVNLDTEGDGDLDVYVAYGFEASTAADLLMENAGSAGSHWLEIDLVGTADADTPVGASVYVGSATHGWQVRQLGHAYHKGNDALTAHLGLGDDAEIAPVVVTWPNGSVEAFDVANVDRRISLTQGQGSPVDISVVNSAPDLGGEPEPEPEPQPGTTPFERIAAMDGLNDDHARVFRLYWAFFDRAPDQQGSEFWVGQVDRCLIDSAGYAVPRSDLLFEITRRFEDSAEFKRKYGTDLSDLEFLQIAYQNVNGRGLDAGGRDFWLGQMANGMSRAEVILRISYEPEFVGRTPLPSDGVTVAACDPGRAFRTFPN